MNKTALSMLILLLAPAILTSFASACDNPQCPPKEVPAPIKPDPLDSILEKLNNSAAAIETYQCRIEYKFSQPLFDSETLRKGDLYYEKTKENSQLRINFTTLKQDKEEPQKYRDEYIFDGSWITHIDYELKQVKKYQQAEPNRKIDAFDLAKRNFPLIGFTKSDDLKKNFEINLIDQKENEIKDTIKLHLKTKPDSEYKKDYSGIDFWIDSTLYLPAKIVAASTEQDLFQITLLKPQMNKKLPKGVFDFEIPRGFGKPEIIPLQKNDEK